MINYRIYFIPIFLLFAHISLSAQHLARRAFFGVRMENITDETARIMNLPAVKGVLVQGTVPGSTAEAAGLERGDIWLTVNDIAINNVATGVETLKKMREGDKFSYSYQRNGNVFTKSAVAKPFPREKYADIDVTYDAVKVDSLLLRTIITRPKKQGKLPAIMFIQGVGCYSLDTPLDTNSSELQLLNNLTRSGYVTFRMDKPGMGDSQGGPCHDMDFQEEANTYLQALRQLKQLDYVDPDRIFIIGHSMGGVFAPLVAKETPVKGIVAYGTIGVNFMEYFLNSRRDIAEANEMTPAEADDYVKLACECYLPYFADGEPQEEILAKKPQCSEHLGDLGRGTPFWNQLYDQNLPGLWSAYNGRVLAIHGSADYISTREEHEYIAATVNKNHPGNGVFAELDGCDHGMHIATSPQQANREHPTTFNPLVLKTIQNWLLQNKA